MADVGAENPSAETEATNGSAGSGRAHQAAADGEEEEDDASVTQKANPESNGGSSSSSSGSAAAAQEGLLLEVRNLMRRITAARPSPHPRFLHTLASILEEEEELYVSSFSFLLLVSVLSLLASRLI
jgi:hypothetical protein